MCTHFFSLYLPSTPFPCHLPLLLEILSDFKRSSTQTFSENSERQTLSNSFHEASITLTAKEDKHVVRKEDYKLTSLLGIDTNFS
jgi:hypothetical protein